MSSVFKNVLDKPLFKHFVAYSKSNSTDEKIRAYASFVSEIYGNNSSFSELVFRLVCEDENVYIKSRAHGERVSDEVKQALRAELETFKDFSLLTVYTYQRRFVKGCPL